MLFADSTFEAAQQDETPGVGGGKVVFARPDRRFLTVGSKLVEDHLNDAKVHAPFVIKQILESMDWSAFESAYKPGGRPPYHPERMVGIVLYGHMTGCTSLRGLEEFARVNLGAIWLGGGICPDHSVIGRFVHRHEQQLTGEFFTTLVQEVLKATGSDAKAVAADGTVIQAAASRFSTVKREAAEQARQEARRAAQAAPEDPQLQKKQQHAEKVAAEMEKRAAKRTAKGKPADKTYISSTEPDAVVQPMKNKQFAPSYKPSVMANENRVVVAAEVDPSSETKVLETMLNKAAEVNNGDMPEQCLLDAGYNCNETIELALNNEIDLLCPEGQLDGPGGSPIKQSKKKYPKGAFDYQQDTDSYRCPAGQLLVPVGSYQGTDSEAAYVEYGTAACANCPLRGKCTTSPKGRRVKRYQSDDKKDALRAVMRQALAQKRYRQRQAMVEPVFSELKGRQGLNRFRRCGLAAVRLEFFIHVAAYNLGRAVAAAVAAATAAAVVNAIRTVIYRALAQVLLSGAREPDVRRTRTLVWSLRSIRYPLPALEVCVAA